MLKTIKSAITRRISAPQALRFTTKMVGTSFIGTAVNMDNGTMHRLTLGEIIYLKNYLTSFNHIWYVRLLNPSYHIYSSTQSKH